MGRETEGIRDGRQLRVRLRAGRDDDLLAMVDGKPRGVISDMLRAGLRSLAGGARQLAVIDTARAVARKVPTATALDDCGADW